MKFRNNVRMCIERSYGVPTKTGEERCKTESTRTIWYVVQSWKAVFVSAGGNTHHH